jgi:hypothetical protein
MSPKPLKIRYDAQHFFVIYITLATWNKAWKGLVRNLGPAEVHHLRRIAASHAMAPAKTPPFLRVFAVNFVATPGARCAQQEGEDPWPRTR